METSSAETGSSQMMNSGLQDQRARDADALALSAGELMRQPPHHQAGIETDGAENLVHAPLALGAVVDAGDHQRLGDDVADAPPWVQRRDRVLEDHLHAPAHLPQGVAPQRHQIDAIEHNLPRSRPAQLQHGTAKRRLAATAFADQTERLAARDARN